VKQVSGKELARTVQRKVGAWPGLRGATVFYFVRSGPRGEDRDSDSRSRRVAPCFDEDRGIGRERFVKELNHSIQPLLAIPVALLLSSGCGCGPNEVRQPTREGRLRGIWVVKGASAEERCGAVNARFTKGTPMRDVMEVLGREDTMIITTTLSWPPETQNQRIWVYRFGAEEVHVHSTGGPTTPLEDRRFAGATVKDRAGLIGSPEH